MAKYEIRRRWLNLVDFFSRPKCHILGCSIMNEYHACERCGIMLYDGFIDQPLILPILHLKWRILELIKGRRCPECGKKIHRDQDYCSDECFEKGLPF
jgi:hypothetical protein